MPNLQIKIDFKVVRFTTDILFVFFIARYGEDKGVPNLLIMSKISLSVAFSYETSEETNGINPNSTNLRVRLMSEWLDCSQLIDNFGEGALSWETAQKASKSPSETQQDFSSTDNILPFIKTSTFKLDIDIPDLNLPEHRLRLQTLNTSPAIYAVVLRQEAREIFQDGEQSEEQRLVPISFVHVDCSKFLMESGTASSSGQSIQMTAIEQDEQEKALPVVPSTILPSPPVNVTMTIHCTTPFLNRAAALELEPLFIDISSICGYPILDDETASDALSSVYVYAKLDLGGALSRTIYARPAITSIESFESGIDMPDSISTEGGTRGPEHISVDCRVCCLAGLIDLARFKEALTSTTFVIQVHRENMSRRSFHARACDEYHNFISKKVEGESSAPAPAPAKPPAKGAPATTVAAVSGINSQPTGPMSEADRFLLSCIQKAMQTAAQVRFHGTGRLRLEQLLRQSVDLLKEFARRRGTDGGEDDVIVREDFLSEVRLSKPSKPLKWHRPEDISLLGALQRDLLEQESRLYGTMAVSHTPGTKLGASGTGVSKSRKSKPRHEQFENQETRLVISAELHRHLSHPSEEPRVFLKVIESFIKDGFTEKKTICDPETMSKLEKRLSVTPFTRMVFAFRYDDDETLLAINDAITKVNKNSLRDIQGSIRSYRFTEQELEACVDGSLDVITGFMVIDDDIRVVVLEGLAAPGKGMQSVFMDIPKTKANDAALKILCSPECLFPARLYGEFGPDLKRIRIRDKLKKLARRPELYNRKQVEEICFSAIDSVMSLRRAVDLKSTKELDMYPSADSLSKVELLYGEAISRSDLDGTAAEADRSAMKRAKKIDKEAKAAEEAEYNNRMYGITSGPAAISKSKQSSMKLDNTNRSFSESRKTMFDPDAPRCAPTECWNDAYEEYLATRPAHRTNFLAEQRELKREAWNNMLVRTAKREAESEDILIKVLGKDAVEAGAKIYCYASQSENFKVKAFSELRNRIAKFNDATYTFSKDFISQTICVVDEDADKKTIEAEKRSHWLTQTGFTYPKPKTLVDLITHPKRPSEARIEDLKDPWSGDAGIIGKSGADHAENLRLERGYSVRVRGGDLFGALKPPSFERDFQLSLVGDKQKLPRGNLIGGGDGDKDPAAFKSVHLGGEGQARIIEEALEKEKADWAAKVVVADTSFKVGGFTNKTKVYQFERTNDILKDEPTRRELKALRDRKSVSGKIDYSYSVAPLSLLSSGPYEANAAATALVRKPNPSKFITVRDIDPDAAPGTRGAKPKDFVRFIDKNANAARIMCVLSKRSIPPLEYDSEAKGPKWVYPASQVSSNSDPATP